LTGAAIDDFLYQRLLLLAFSHFSKRFIILIPSLLLYYEVVRSPLHIIMRISLFLTSLITLINLSTAAPVEIGQDPSPRLNMSRVTQEPAHRGKDPSTPGNHAIQALAQADSFYAAPKGFENKELGEILRYREAPRPISLDNRTPLKPKEAWQIQFRTQNSMGEPEAGMVTVLVPWKAKPGNLFVEGYFADAAWSW
jgi:hypothetical protein